MTSHNNFPRALLNWLRELRVRLSHIQLKFFGRRLRELTFHSHGKPLQVILGAGSTSFPGWISTDIVNRNNYYFDFTKKWNLTNKISLLYGDMILASMNREELHKFFEQCFQSLVSGGKVRFCTIDYENICRLYLEKGQEANSLLDRNREKGFLADYPVDLLFHSVCSHFPWVGKIPKGSFLHDSQIIASYLTTVGFGNVEIFPANLSYDSRFNGLESRSSAIEAQMQICFEATKI